MLEFQLTPNSITAVQMWLVGLLGVSLLLTLVYLLPFANQKFAFGAKCDRLSSMTLAVLASFQILAWQLYFYHDSHEKVALWCFATAVTGGALLWRFVSTLQPATSRTFPFAIALISIVELVGFAQATRQFCESIPTSKPAEPGNLVVKLNFSAATDSGTEIPLFERKITPEALRNYLEMCHFAIAAFSEKAMLRAQPFAESNCHGWVFAKGEHIVRGEDVQLILEENNYQEVSKAEPNDIAIYRGEKGEILHTGLVRGSLQDATIVESKWGIGALYLHIAEEQPYSQSISYYRTDRKSHEISISHGQQTPKSKILPERMAM